MAGDKRRLADVAVIGEPDAVICFTARTIVTDKSLLVPVGDHHPIMLVCVPDGYWNLQGNLIEELLSRIRGCLRIYFGFQKS